MPRYKLPNQSGVTRTPAGSAAASGGTGKCTRGLGPPSLGARVMVRLGPARALVRTGQYALAIMNPSQEMMRRTNNLVPPAGPYGNQVTTDATAFPAFTMDYNQEATFCTRQFAPKPLACCADCALVSGADGVLPANHEDYFMGYAQPILDWMPAARLSAQAHAKQIGRVCPAESLQ